MSVSASMSGVGGGGGSLACGIGSAVGSPAGAAGMGVASTRAGAAGVGAGAAPGPATGAGPAAGVGGGWDLRMLHSILRAPMGTANKKIPIAIKAATTNTKDNSFSSMLKKLANATAIGGPATNSPPH